MKNLKNKNITSYIKLMRDGGGCCLLVTMTSTLCGRRAEFNNSTFHIGGMIYAN